MVFAPPRHGKSEIVSRRLPAYILGRDPNAQIIACSYSDDLAGRNNRDVQRIIDSDGYRALFPQTQLFGKFVRNQASGRWLRNSDLFEIPGFRGAYRSAGVGGGITGMGCTYGVIDDPIKNEEEAYSPTVRRKILDWYQSTFYTRLERDARVLITMTRWHKEDLAGALIEANGEHWTVLSLPAIHEEGDAASADDPRSVGEPLWADRYPLAKLKQTRETLGPTKWAAMYQQTPRAAAGAEWPDEYFGDHLWFDSWPPAASVRARVVALDPSKGKDARWGDYSAFVKLAWADGCLWCDADMANDRNVAEITATAVEIQRTFAADAFGVESNQFQELLADNIREASCAAGVPLPMYQINNQVNKLVRIRRLSPYLAQRMIRFKGGSPGARLLVQQLREFPNGDHDDGPDALEMAIRILLGIVDTVDDGLGNRLLV